GEVRGGTDHASGQAAHLNTCVADTAQAKSRFKIRPRPAMSLIGSARANRDGLGEIAFRLEGDPVDVAVKGSGQDRRVDADRRKRDCDEREREPASELADPEDLTITHSGVSPHSPAS